MTVKDETRGRTPNSKRSEVESKNSKASESPNLTKLDDLLDAWDDDENSGVHIEELHVHHPTGGYTTYQDEPTRPTHKLPEVAVEPPRANTPSITPKARNITIIIVAVATGLGTAMKILWDAWTSLKR